MLLFVLCFWIVDGDEFEWYFSERWSEHDLLLVRQRHKVINHEHCTEDGHDDVESSRCVLLFSNITWNHCQIDHKCYEHHDRPCCVTHVVLFLFLFHRLDKCCNIDHDND